MEPIPKTSNLAITSLLFACPSPVIFVFGSIPAIILGVMALRQIDAHEVYTGRKLAKAGLILGILFTLGSGVYLIWLVIVLSNFGPVH